MRLSPTWKRAYRRFSFQAMSWALGFIAWWGSDSSPDIKEIITPFGAFLIIAFLLVMGMIGTMIDQPSVTRPRKERW